AIACRAGAREIAERDGPGVDRRPTLKDDRPGRRRRALRRTPSRSQIKARQLRGFVNVKARVVREQKRATVDRDFAGGFAFADPKPRRQVEPEPDFVTAAPAAVQHEISARLRAFN